MTNWDDYRFFLAVVRRTSIKKAAEELGVNRSTVLRRITAFEEELGVRLFERLPNGYFTTVAGEEILETAEQVEGVTYTVNRRIAGWDSKLSGNIRVSVSSPLAAYVLMPEITSFNRSHPEIKLEILASYEMPDLTRREADIAIRISNDPPEDLVGRRILKVARAIYVSAEHLPNANQDASVSPLNWVGWSANPSSLQWVEDSEHPNLPVSTIITDPYVTVKALREGMGMSILPCFIGDSEPDLYRMPPGKLQHQRDLWVLTHADMRNTARIRIFTNFIIEAFLRNRDLLEGKCPRKLPEI